MTPLTNQGRTEKCHNLLRNMMWSLFDLGPTLVKDVSDEEVAAWAMDNPHQYYPPNTVSIICWEYCQQPAGVMIQEVLNVELDKWFCCR